MPNTPYKLRSRNSATYHENRLAFANLAKLSRDQKVIIAPIFQHFASVCLSRYIRPVNRLSPCNISVLLKTQKETSHVNVCERDLGFLHFRASSGSVSPSGNRKENLWFLSSIARRFLV